MVLNFGKFQLELLVATTKIQNANGGSDVLVGLNIFFVNNQSIIFEKKIEIYQCNRDRTVWRKNISSIV